MTYSECVCSLEYSARNAHAPNCHLWPASLYSIFLHYLVKGTTLEESYWNASPFSPQLCLKQISLLEEVRDTLSKMYFGLYVKYPLFLSYFNESRTSSTDFRKVLKYKVTWKSVLWEQSCSMRTDRRTGIKKLIVIFCNFVNAP